MKIKEAIEYWEVFNSEIDDLYNTCSDEERGILEKQRDVVEFTISALRELVARRSNRSKGTGGMVMPKVWCAEILCEHNKNNQCKANEINLSAGNIHTVNEGFRQIWTCRAFAMRDDAKKLKVFIEEFYKSRGYGDV